MTYLFSRKTALILYILVIIIVSLMPVTGTSSIEHLDKVQHVTAYAGLAILICLALPSQNGRLLGIIGAILLGILIEIIQPIIADRERSFWDFLANSVGIGFGIFVYWRWKRPLEALARKIESIVLPPY